MTPSLALIAALAGSAWMFWLVPTLSRPGLFFGVTVSPDFRNTDFAHVQVRRYRSAVIVSAAIALSVVALDSSRGGRWSALLLHSLGPYCAWLWIRRDVLPYARPLISVRSAVVTQRDTRVPGGPLALAGPFIIVAVTALFVATQWDAIPEKFPSMQRGSPGRLVTKSTNTVFAPFVFGAALLTAFTLQTAFTLKRTRQIAATGPAAEAEVRFKRRMALQSLIASYLLAIGASWFSAHRVLDIGQNGMPAPGFGDFFLAAILIFAGVFTVWAVRAGQGGQRNIPWPTDADAGDATPDTAWKAGLLYFNPADPTVFVETRLGVGWSLNFGNVWSWVFLAIGLGVPMLVLRLMR